MTRASRDGMCRMELRVQDSMVDRPMPVSFASCACESLVFPSGGESFGELGYGLFGPWVFADHALTVAE